MRRRRKPQRYMLLRDSEADPNLKAGMVVYDLEWSDYGAAENDEQVYKEPCRSVTLRADGGYPFAVVPIKDLIVI